MRHVRMTLTCCLWVLSLVLPSWAQGVLENPPPPTSFQSGIGIVSGWKCTGGNLTFTIDNGPAAQLAYGTSRNDTIPVCGDNNNGFGSLFNWNLVGDGQHTIRVYDNGVQFASAAFTVTTLGGEFLTGLRGKCDLDGFPHVDKDVSLQWQQSVQNFVIASVSDMDPVELVADQVANLTTDSVFAVPAGKRLVITDVVVSNSNSGSSCCARISRNGAFMTSSIAVAAGSSLSHTFATGIAFAAGNVVAVRNGARAGPISFSLRGFLTNP